MKKNNNKKQKQNERIVKIAWKHKSRIIIFSSTFPIQKYRLETQIETFSSTLPIKISTKTNKQKNLQFLKIWKSRKNENLKILKNSWTFCPSFFFSTFSEKNRDKKYINSFFLVFHDKNICDLNFKEHLFLALFRL